jgi:hypothetical protein
MARTTIDIETPVLEEIRKFQKKDGRSISRIISQLLAEALVNKKAKTPSPSLKWTSRPMKALINLSDKDTLYRILDRRES